MSYTGNPNPTPHRFQPGNKYGCVPKKGKGCGRKPTAELMKRKEILEQLWDPNFDPSSPNVHPIIRRLREIAETSSSSATAEYIVNQVIGSPKTVVRYEVSDVTVFEALGKVLPNFVDEETSIAILNALNGELSGSDSESEG